MCIASKSGEVSKLFISRGSDLVRVETNHVFRGTVLPVEQRLMVPAARDLFATGLSLPTLAVAELYGGKLAAAMDRQHPRDLFDVHGLYAGDGLAPEVVDCFVCYPEHRRVLVSLVEAEPDWTEAPCPHLSEMPALQWQLQNLRKLRSSNPRKYADQSKELKERLGL